MNSTINSIGIYHPKEKSITLILRKGWKHQINGLKKELVLKAVFCII